MAADLNTAESTILGVKTATLLCSFIGAALSLSYAKEMTRAQAVVAVLTGTSVAVFAAPLALHYLGLSEVFERAVAFFIGLLAIRAVPVVLGVVERFRDIKLPNLPDNKE